MSMSMGTFKNRLEVVTPLFLGNAVQKVEFRPPSLKGVMRFWHRAQGPHCLKTEGEVFGSSGKSKSGQAAFSACWSKRRQDWKIRELVRPASLPGLWDWRQ